MTHRTATRRPPRTQSQQGSAGKHTKNGRLKISGKVDAPKSNPALAYLASLGKVANRVQFGALVTIARLWRKRQHVDPRRLRWETITAGDIARIQAALAARYAPGTANRMLTALRRVLRYTWRAGALAYDDYLRLVDIDPVRGEPLPRGRALRESELEALYAVCARDRSPAGVRDGLAIALMHAAGLREAEAAALDVEQVVDRARGELVVYGKGGTIDGATLGSGAEWLRAWIEVRGDEPGRLLHQVRRTGVVVPLGLCPAALYQIVRRRAKEAGLRGMSPHDLRRTHATALLRAGFDHLMVMRSLRHRDVRSVRCYDRRSDEERSEAQRKAIRVQGPGGER